MMSFWPFVVLQFVIFIGLVMVLRRLLSRNLTDATAHLQTLNGEYMRRQEELKRRLEEAEQQYQEQVQRAQAEAERLVAQARQEAETSKARLLQDARAESERIVQQGIESREAIQHELAEAMDARVVERACELLQTSLPVRVREEIQAQWMEELIANGLGQLSRVKVEHATQEAKVVSAFPLSAAQRRALSQKLKEQLGREVTLTESTDERLVAGLTVTLGSLVLDGSVASKVRQAARQAQPHGS